MSRIVEMAGAYAAGVWPEMDQEGVLQTQSREDFLAGARAVLEEAKKRSVYTTPTHAGPEVLTEELFIAVSDLEALFTPTEQKWEG